MKYLSIYMVSFAAVLTLLLAGCDSNITQQDNAPPLNSQAVQKGKLSSVDTTNNLEPRVIDGKYIVIFKNQFENRITQTVVQEADRLIDQVTSSFSISKDSILGRYQYAIKGFAAKLSKAKVEALKKDPRIKRITPSVLYKLQYGGYKKGSISSIKKRPIANYSLTSSQTTPWGVIRVDGPLDGSGKKAWVIGGGIDLDHPDLNVDVTNSASFIADESADDVVGHGTYVAGILAAKDNNIDVVGGCCRGYRGSGESL